MINSGCIFFLCFYRSTFQETLWLHLSHWNFNPSWTDCLCRMRVAFCSYVVLCNYNCHNWILFLYVSLCWFSLCFKSEPWLLKVLEHSSHWNGFSDVCVIICDCRFRWERNLFSHMLHLNSLVLIVWMVLCFFRLSSVAKVWLHSSHFWFFNNLCLGKVVFLCLLFLCFIRLLWKIGSLQISHWTFYSCDLMW